LKYVLQVWYPAFITGAGLPPSYTQLGMGGGFYFRGHWVLYGNVPSCHQT